MTTKYLTANSISIRPQDDAEKILMSNIYAMYLAGKKPCITFRENKLNGVDLVLEIKSDKD